MIQGYRLAGKGYPPKGSRPRQPACSTEELSKKFRLMEWGPSCIGYFAADVGYGSRPCENSTRYNRTRNFGLYGHAESEKTQNFVFSSALRPNQISFSHGQDPKATSNRLKATMIPLFIAAGPRDVGVR